MAAKDNINNTEWKAGYDNLASKVDDLSTRFSTTDVSNPGCAGQDTEGIWQDLRNAQDSSTRLSTDVDLLRKEMAELREKNTMMYKALLSLQSDNKQLRQDIRMLQDRDHQQQQDNQLDLSSLPAEQFQPELITLQKNINKLEEEIKSLRTENAELRMDVTHLKTETETGSKTLTSQVGKLETQIDQMQKDKVHHEHVYCDGCHGAVNGIRYKCLSCPDYDLCEKCRGKGIHRHHKLLIYRKPAGADAFLRGKLGAPVAFTADLSERAITTKEGSLVCDHVLTNIGEGYNKETGVFTAPVAGTYLFLLTLAADCKNSASAAKAWIMVGDRVIGVAFCKGSNWSTGHIVAEINSGEKVRLKVDSNVQYFFEENWTTFSGMLLQPKLF